MASKPSFRAHLLRLVASTSAGALFDTDEQALDALEQQFRTTNHKPLQQDDVIDYLDTQYAALSHENARHLPAVEAEELRWLRRTIPAQADSNAVVTLLADAKRSNDDISSDLLDHIGFDAIHLVPLILSRRSALRAEFEADPNTLAEKVDDLHQQMPSGVNTPLESDSDAHYVDGVAGTAARNKRSKQRRDGRPKEIKFALTAGQSIEELEKLHLQRLEDAAARPLISNPNGYAHEDAPRYPHVYANHAAAAFGSKTLLPLGTTKMEHEHYSETSLPAPPKHPSTYTAQLLPISSLPALVQRSFPYKELNRLQSIVYPTAYETTENMLVCAPTGAGKTDVAVLTVLRAISMYADVRVSDGKMRNKDFKVVYVAPMKALASEIVVKMRKRFTWCGLSVRELTGDMQLTRQEIAETQMIVTTPEKWDVVTRKQTGEGELASLLRLLIIDEVHLLHEDRGSVLESIVARTLRQVESSQTLIRIVGLSATLPNYVDVADFLRVNPYKGLFYFDSSFRPVPLEQHFIAAKGKPGSQTSKDNLDHATFDKAIDLVKEGHQVLIFVHARKDTVKTAQMIKEKAVAEGEMELLNGKDHPNYESYRREMMMSRNREMKELIDVGIGIHHAGMLRSDRNLSERLFEHDVTKILVCTATLAWGVNLPAYAVIIKGTQLYDSSKGQFMDLSILDVLQMFGRAGRPQYETHGVAYIATTSDKVDHYITAVNQQVPIESKFVAGLVDSLNAEVSLGTVASVDEGVRWLGYTFLQVRMRKNPLVYGLSSADVYSDPSLGTRRRELIVNACKLLRRNGMVQYDEDVESLSSTELGSIAAKYYLRSASVETFNSLFRPNMTEADLLSLLSKSTEFQQVAVRDSEADELKNLVENVIPCQVKGGADTSDGKSNVLLQAYISKAAVQDFALVSDMGYVSQNSARIARSLLDIAVARKWSQASAALLSICKAIEKRLWPWCHPLEQVSLSADLLYNLNRWAEDMTIDDMVSMTASDLGKAIRMNERLGEVLLNAAKQFPRVKVRPRLQPISADMLRVRCTILPKFKWNDKLHGKTEYFWIWLSDAEDQHMLQFSRVAIKQNTTNASVDFHITLADRPQKLHVRAMSDTWHGSETTEEIDVADLILPSHPPAKRQILDLVVNESQLDSRLAQLLGNRTGVQGAFELQCWHSLFFTRANTLVAAPASASRTFLTMLPIWQAITTTARSLSLVLAANPAQARRVYGAVAAILNTFSRSHKMDLKLIVKQSEVHTAVNKPRAQSNHLILVTTPRILRNDLLRSASQGVTPLSSLDLVVAEDVQSLAPDYELVLSQLIGGVQTPKAPRLAAFSHSLLDSESLARWLNVKPAHSFCFSPSSRPSPITTTFTQFNLPYGAALLKAMIKPAYTAMRANFGTTICFVPHRSQCYSTIADLVTTSATEMNRLVEMDEEILAQYAERISDPKIAEAIQHGFAMLTESMSPSDQAIVRHLFKSNAIRALVTSRDSCFSLDLTANLVIAMSTQYAVYDRQSSERSVVDYPLEDLLKMQAIAAEHNADTANSTLSAAVGSTGFGQCLIYTQPEKASLYSRFLNDGLPLESALPRSDPLFHTLLSGIADGSISTKQKCLDALASSYFAERLAANPLYYLDQAQLGSGSKKKNELLSLFIDEMLEEMRSSLLIRFAANDGTAMSITAFGDRVSRLRFPQSQLSDLFAASSQAILKIVDKDAQAQEAIEDVRAQELNDFVGRLPKSLQRRMPLQAPLANGHTNDSQPPSSAAGEGASSDYEPKAALMLSFVHRKLPPHGSRLEIAQAKLALLALQKLQAVTKQSSRSS